MITPVVIEMRRNGNVVGEAGAPGGHDQRQRPHHPERRAAAEPGRRRPARRFARRPRHP